MRKLSLAEKVLCLVTYQLETRNRHISEVKLKELLGHPPKSTYYRVVKMLTDGGVDYRPLLKEVSSEAPNRKYYFYFNINR